MGNRLYRLRGFIHSLGLFVRDLLQPINLLAVVILLILAYVGVTWVMGKFREGRLARERKELEVAVADLQQRNEALRRTAARLEAQCKELQGFVRRLGAESRVAEARIVDKRPDPQDAKVPLWTVEFVEVGRDGKPLPAKVITLRGEEAYFDALVIKFTDDLVKVGDPLRGKSLHFFRRAFGSAQEPREGPVIAAASGSIVPDAYRPPGTVSAFEHSLWLRFWHWAAHPNEAEAEGIRVAQIEAVGIRPVQGATYRLTLEHDGGLNIAPVVPRKP